MSARAISSSLRWPPDSSPANSSRMCVRLNRASSSSARSVISASCWRHPARQSARKKFSPVWPAAPSFMLSSTVSRASALVSWNVRTIPRRAMRYDVSPSSVSPSNDHVPELGLSKPVSRLKNVVLPAPLGPMSAVMAPRSTSQWSTLTAVRPPNRRVMLSATRIGSFFGTPGRCSISPKRSRRQLRECRLCGHAASDTYLSWRAISRRSPKMPWGRKISSSMRPRPTRTKRTLPGLVGVQDAARDVFVGHQLVDQALRERQQGPEDHRADDRAPDAGHAAQDERGVGVERGDRAEAAGHDRGLGDDPEHAAHRPDDAAEDEALHLVAVDVLAEGPHGVLVLADGLEDAAPRAAHEQVDEQDGQQHERPARRAAPTPCARCSATARSRRCRRRAG